MGFDGKGDLLAISPVLSRFRPMEVRPPWPRPPKPTTTTTNILHQPQINNSPQFEFLDLSLSLSRSLSLFFFLSLLSFSPLFLSLVFFFLPHRPLK
ncbi:hypothetical protein Scep_013029 [Stephania cephalantha]|uniref:Transmembrane protein n=1 Tax=Stephania cephalantha TaxID=152367 RepID=A0AAP0JHI2_9MAGN